MKNFIYRIKNLIIAKAHFISVGLVSPADSPGCGRICRRTQLGGEFTHGVSSSGARELGR